MNENKFINEQPEQVIIIPGARTIHIDNAVSQRAYGLFDTQTGVQVSNFVKGNDGQIAFNNLEPGRHYDVGVIENPGDEKPEFNIIWSQEMRDETDLILSNSGNLPVVYPETYYIHDNVDKSGGVYDLVNDNGETVGQVAKLAPQGDKPYFNCVKTFRMKDNAIE